MMKLTQLCDEIERGGIKITASNFALLIKVYRLTTKIISLQK